MSLPTASKPNQAASTQPVIELDHIAVRYRVPQERIPSLKEYAIRWLKRQMRYQHFWALDDVSVSIQPGEVFGIIGPNGAGKSTLLKVVARVLRPTRGRVRIRGRVAPLLELGAGFNHELTGRENILLNGTILGFPKKDIESRFDRIVEFSGLGDFIDAPLRTYSSGMIARLGFAVATDVRPGILIVDEILGVGDAAFQKKSFERILEFQAQGTTILLVSHALERVSEMCSRAIWLENGKVVFEGSAKSAVNQYLFFDTEQESKNLVALKRKKEIRRRGNRKIDIYQVQILNSNEEEQFIFETGDTVLVRMSYRTQEPVQEPIFGVAIHRQDGVHITGPNTQFSGQIIPIADGEGIVQFKIPYLPLLDGLYHFSVAATNRNDTAIFDYHDRAYTFRITNQADKQRERYGLLTVRGEWEYFSKLNPES
jgi:lipopolysaccharide transport system ATP-binding protein